MDTRSQAATASWINVIAGGWLIISPFIFGNPAPFQSNEFWVGMLIGVVALIRAFAPARNVWLSWVNLAAGVWLLVSPFVIGYSINILIWNSLILGAIVTADAIWNLAASSNTRQMHAGV